MRVFAQPPLFCASCGDLMALTGYQPPHLAARKGYRELVCKNSACAEFDKIGRQRIEFLDLEQLVKNERREG